MLRLKLLWKKDWFRLLVIALVFAIVMLAVRRQPGIWTNLSDFFFSMGTMFFLAGGTRYIRNVGLFKTFSYMAYKRRFRRSAGRSAEVHPMSLAEYTQTYIYDETRQKPAAWPLSAGAVCWLASFLLVLAV